MKILTVCFLLVSASCHLFNGDGADAGFDAGPGDDAGTNDAEFTGSAVTKDDLIIMQYSWSY